MHSTGIEMADVFYASGVKCGLAVAYYIKMLRMEYSNMISAIIQEGALLTLYGRNLEVIIAISDSEAQQDTRFSGEEYAQRLVS